GASHASVPNRQPRLLEIRPLEVGRIRRADVAVPMRPVEDLPDLLPAVELVVKTEAERDEAADDTEGELQVVRGHFPHHVPLGSDAHAVVHGQLDQRDQAGDPGQDEAGPRLESAEGPQQDQVDEAEGQLVEVFHLVANDLEVSEVERDEDRGQEGGHDVEEEQQAQREGVVVDVREGLGGAGQRDALHHCEEEGAPELEHVKSSWPG
ncbi:hypothetical protein ACHAWF_005670, partial [Thalassiosira exigua]